VRVLVTGGAGFIGANFVRQTLAEHPDVTVTVLDALTYAGALASLESVADRIDFVHGDIADLDLVDEFCSGVDAIVHFAADTHVDKPLRPAVASHLDRRGLRRLAAGPGAVHRSHAVPPVESLLDDEGLERHVGACLDPVVRSGRQSPTAPITTVRINTWRSSFRVRSPT